jgi:hypothetical protein
MFPQTSLTSCALAQWSAQLKEALDSSTHRLQELPTREGNSTDEVHRATCYMAS